MRNDPGQFLLVTLCLFGSIAVLLSIPAATDQRTAGPVVRRRRPAGVTAATAGTASGHALDGRETESSRREAHTKHHHDEDAVRPKSDSPPSRHGQSRLRP
jgi:hypothetical protein